MTSLIQVRVPQFDPSHFSKISTAYSNQNIKIKLTLVMVRKKAKFHLDFGRSQKIPKEFTTGPFGSRRILSRLAVRPSDSILYICRSKLKYTIVLVHLSTQLSS